MITIRPAAERGATRLGWLDSRHTFSFNMYYDARWSGYSTLLVLNDDRVRAGQGFGTHGHHDMEILSWVLEGALAHRDSLGSGSVLRPGRIQRMSAGSGVRHSEFNASVADPLRFLQIWIVPEREGIDPAYEEKELPEAELDGRLRLAASRDGRDGSVRIHQDTEMWVGRLGPGARASHALADDRRAWVQVATGSVTLNGTPLDEGDGAAVEDESTIELVGRGEGARSEVLVFDLP